MSSKYRSELIKLAVFLVVAVVITISVIASLLDLKLGQSSASYKAVFISVNGLQSGDVVRIAGVEVGKVTGLSVDHRTYLATVHFTAFTSQHLTTTSRASVEFENLLGQRYLGLTAGPAGGQPLHSGASIPVTQTNPGLDLTTVFSGFQPLIAALNPTQVNELTSSIIQVLQGESGAINNLLAQTASFTTNLAQRQTVIYEVLDNLTPLLTKVNTRNAQIGSLVAGFDSLVRGLAGQRNQIGTAVDSLSTLTANVSNLLSKSQPSLDNDITGLQNASGVLLANQGPIDSLISDLPAFLNSIDKISSSGNYLAVYICDLTLHASGPISVKLSSTVPQSPPLAIPTGVVGSPSQHTPVCQ
jgi:phospholipid/cholesterol/gamma-HCH transport system substrate-binding protein